MNSISEYLINECGFIKYHVHSDRQDDLDLDKFSCVLRIHEIHYLYFSEDYKYFTLAKRLENPKGEPGVKGKSKQWEYMMIPKCIRTIEDAANLLNGMVDFEYMKCICQ